MVTIMYPQPKEITMQMELFKVGTEVEITGGITGKIDLIQINALGACYQVAWWDGRSRLTAWFCESELIVVCGERGPVGFK